MSRAAARRAASAADEDDDDRPQRKGVGAGAGARKKPAPADDFPAAFDMGDLEAELKEVESKPAPSRSRGKGGGAGVGASSRRAEPREEPEMEEEMSPPPKRNPRFASHESASSKPASKAASKPASKAGSKPGSRRNSGERARPVRMEELDRWRWASKYADTGDEDDEKLAANLALWDKVPLPDPEAPTDVAATMMFRKWLWKNKKLCRAGIPPVYRLFIWDTLSGARTMPDRLEHLNRYESLCDQLKDSSILSSKAAKEIAADVPRVLKGHPKYTKNKEGQEELTRVLSAFAIRSPNIGYVNSLSHIAAFFLLYYKESDAFWILCAIVDIVLPPDYFTQSLLGVRADCMLMKVLVYARFPKLHAHFATHGVDVYNSSLKWMMTLYFLCLPKDTIARVLDVLFLEGADVLVSIGLALFAMHEKEILAMNDLMTLLDFIQNKMGAEIADNDAFMKLVLKDSKCRISEEEQKRRQTERAVMENAYMKDLQRTQLHRSVEETRRKEYLDAEARRQKEEEQTLELGIEMLKLGVHGDPKLTTVSMERVPGEDWVISWESKRKKAEAAQMRLSQCSLYFGLRHGNFASRAEYQKRFQTARKNCFSLINDERSLDLVCQTAHDMDSWKRVFFRSGFPVRNQKQVVAFRRRIEAKKTAKRSKAAAQGKPNWATMKIESEEEDYDISDTELDRDVAAMERAMDGTSSSSSSAPPLAMTAAQKAREKEKEREAEERAKEEEKPSFWKKAPRRKFDED